MNHKESDVGLIGVGVMGGNLALNVTDHGFSISIYDTDSEKTSEFIEKQADDRKIWPGFALKEFVESLRRPRSIILLVPAGPPVDAACESLASYLEAGDLIVDGGNSHFIDTDRRNKSLTEKGLHFMGMGISGGEQGARRGPSLMPGGPADAYERVRPVLEAVAANVDGEPCVAHLGNGSAGHYVKMVHNGIEYGMMELLAETYDILKRGLGMKADAVGAVFERWNRGKLSSYLMEITADIFRRRDDKKPDEYLIDMILDQARQKGTGKWTSWDALDLGVPAPTIDAAVMMRNLSGRLPERKVAAEVLRGPEKLFEGDHKRLLAQLERALLAASILIYTQGMALMADASAAYEYDLNLEAVARIWRGGCIIRSALLHDIRSAYEAQPNLPNLLMDHDLGQEVTSRQEDLRAVVQTAVSLGLPLPGFMSALAYFDAYRSAWLPANLIQAQRDYFGAHTYERIDTPGLVHTAWKDPE